MRSSTSQASGFLGSSQVITLITEVGLGHVVFGGLGGHAASFGKGISKIDRVNIYH